MTRSTKSLVARLKRFAVPLGTAAALLFATSFFFLDQSAVHAAPAQTQPQISEQSIAPIVSLDKAVEAVSAHVMPAVVNISVTIKNKQDQSRNFGGIPPNALPPEFRQFFFGGPGMGQQQQQPRYEYGVGSGFIISPDGYIVTNHHVVDGATRIQVTMHDRQTYTAKLVGIDDLDDLAVIKIDATNLPTVTWGDSSQLKPGESVLAFGSPFGSLTFSVTRGIVSAVNRGVGPGKSRRTPRDYIQTDAAINPGNSGGPLVNARGQVVGIDTFIYTNSGTFAGAGFAIPAQIAQHSVNEIIKTGKVVHGYLGIGIRDVTPQYAGFFKVPTAAGALVEQVTPDAPASKAGLERGDVIRTINGKEIADSTALQVAVTEMSPGTPITIGILRDGKPMTMHATVGEYHAGGQEAGGSGSGKTQHAQLGIAVQDLTQQTRQQLDVPGDVNGVAIQSVRAGSPADLAGLSPGDVIMQVNRNPVTSAQNFVDQVQAIPAGKSVLLLIWTKQGTAYIVVQTDAGNPDNNQ